MLLYSFQFIIGTSLQPHLQWFSPIYPTATMAFNFLPNLNRKSAMFDFMVLAMVSRCYSKDSMGLNGQLQDQPNKENALYYNWVLN